MAREVLVSVLCDLCLAGDERVPGEELPALPTKSGPRRLALCERHRKELWDPLAAVLDEHGQSTDLREQPAEPEAGRVCPVCGHSTPSRQGLSSHVRRVHGVGLSEVAGLLAAGQYECTECARTFTTPQGLGRHRLTVHGVPGAR